MLNTLIFTVDNYIFKKKKKKNNVSLGLSQLQSSILLLNAISLYHIVNAYYLYYILYIIFVIIYFVCKPRKFEVKQPERLRIDLKAYYVVT